MPSSFASLHQVSKHYPQPDPGIINQILNDITFSVGPKDSVAIVGPSGSGKSTLLNILGTLDRPSSGKVVLDAKDTEGFDDSRLAGIRNQFLGFVFQMHHLLPQLTLMENVLLPVMPVHDREKQKSAEERARKLIERVGLQECIHRRPAQLSPGECQRAAVVRALVNRPRLLLADEPTGSLDAGNAGKLGDLLVELHRENDLAMVVVTHSLELASRMEKIYHLASGKINQIK
jgi:ABC-type lipoprotein export system ATPase subunit